MSPRRVRPRGILMAGEDGRAPAISGRCRAMLTTVSGMSVGAGPRGVRGSVHRRAQQLGLPGQEQLVEFLGLACELCELRAVGDQRRLQLELGGDTVAQ